MQILDRLSSFICARTLAVRASLVVRRILQRQSRPSSSAAANRLRREPLLAGIMRPNQLLHLRRHRFQPPRHHLCFRQRVDEPEPGRAAAALCLGLPLRQDRPGEERVFVPQERQVDCLLHRRHQRWPHVWRVRPRRCLPPGACQVVQMRLQLLLLRLLPVSTSQ